MTSTNQPPASNPGADDATAGMAKGAGGASATSAIDSPVPGEQKTIVGIVMETLGLSGQQEQRAEDVSAHAPDTASTTIPASASTNTTTAPTSTSSSEPSTHAGAHDQTYVGAIGGAAAAGTAAVANYITGKSNTEQESVGTSTTVGTDASTKTTTESVADSAASTAKAASDTVKDTVTGSDEHKSGEDHPKKVSDHEAAIRENKSAIPTAGGQRLGEGHWGESKVVPDVPKAQGESASKVSSTEGQPDQSTADNTAKNTGHAAGGPEKHGAHDSTSSSNDHEGEHDKQKLVDKLKHKLHLDKKDKA